MVFSMLQAPTRNQTFLTLWDMDDTSVATDNKFIKNAHLLLPVLLFQTRSPNQHFGILTNRSQLGEDDESLLPITQYLKMLESFGISIPDDHIVFAGGGTDNANLYNTEYQQLMQALAVIETQIQSLKLTTAGVELDRALPKIPNNPKRNEATGPFAQLIAAKYYGKNFHINTFLKNHYHEASKEYRFQTGSCPFADLMVLMVDDLQTIAEETRSLDNRFIGIKASEGGRPPKGAEDSKAYHQDDYLLEVAETIGLAAYARNLLADPKKYSADDAMLQMSALLYAWHAFPGEIDFNHFTQFDKWLVATEREQIANMLEYIQLHPNTHRHAHYRPVDALASLFRNFVDHAFLNRVADQLKAIKQKQAAITRLPSSTSDTDLPAESKKKGLGSLIRNLSLRSGSAIQREPDNANKRQETQLEQLAQEERALKERLATLLLSPDPETTHKAQKTKETIERESSYNFTDLFRTSESSASTSTSASSSSVTVDDVLVENRRRSFTPLVKPVYVSNTNIETPSTKPTPPRQTAKK